MYAGSELPFLNIGFGCLNMSYHQKCDFRNLVFCKFLEPHLGLDMLNMVSCYNHLKLCECYRPTWATIKSVISLT